MNDTSLVAITPKSGIPQGIWYLPTSLHDRTIFVFLWERDLQMQTNQITLWTPMVLSPLPQVYSPPEVYMDQFEKLWSRKWKTLNSNQLYSA